MNRPASANQSSGGRCDGSAGRVTRDLALPVLAVEGHSPRGSRVRASRSGPRRAIVLVAIQVVIVLHVVLWLLSRKYGWFDGWTLAPVEPSEAMQTLELGFINAGFVFFAVALLSTLVFGRWVCGWACHVVMLQDFCGWLMKKMGVRPRPFRSRLLIYVPLAIALYMFVWPTVKRLAVVPALDRWWPEATTAFVPPAPWQGWSNHLMTRDFWINPDARIQFPIIMAVPTLFIVGFAAVYFLGSKGFCTYGCPYGGFFAPLDEFAPGRIRVDHDRCEGCGHCTAVCTSNVRVHEEVRDFGMVVDPGCMKCLDCVSVCPNDALRFGFGAPAALARASADSRHALRVRGERSRTRPKSQRQYDLSLGEDIGVALVFVIALLGFRGLYLGEGVPLLMAVGLAGMVAFLSFKTWRVVRRMHDLVTIQSLRVKTAGRITPWGWALVGTTVLLGLVAVQNLVVNASRWRADAISRSGLLHFAQVPAEVERPAGARGQAAIALAHVRRSMGVSDGGIAIMTEPSLYSQAAALHGVRGEFDLAVQMLDRFLASEGPSDEILAARLHQMYLAGDAANAVAEGERLVEIHPDFAAVYDETVRLKRDVEGLASAITYARAAVERAPERVAALRSLGELLAFEGPFEEAVQVCARALAIDPDDVRSHMAAGEAYFKSGNVPKAREVIEGAIERLPREPMLRMQYALILRLLGEDNAADAQRDLAERLSGRRAGDA
jgi:polyferredoxin